MESSENKPVIIVIGENNLSQGAMFIEFFLLRIAKEFGVDDLLIEFPNSHLGQGLEQYSEIAPLQVTNYENFSFNDLQYKRVQKIIRARALGMEVYGFDNQRTQNSREQGLAEVISSQCTPERENGFIAELKDLGRNCLVFTGGHHLSHFWEQRDQLLEENFSLLFLSCTPESLDQKKENLGKMLETLELTPYAIERVEQDLYLCDAPPEEIHLLPTRLNKDSGLAILSGSATLTVLHGIYDREIHPESPFL